MISLACQVLARQPSRNYEIWHLCKSDSVNRSSLQQSSANSGCCDSDAGSGSNCCCNPQQQILAPEIGPSSNWAASGAPCSDHSDCCPEHGTDQQCRRVGVRVCNWSAKKKKPWRRDDNSNQSGDCALSAPAQQHDDHRHQADRCWWNKRSEWSSEKNSSPVPTRPTSNWC
jgi:hypothetical protein